MIVHYLKRLRSPNILWIMIAAVVLLRLSSLGIYPLADTTEARYGGIARLMLETGDWITPQISLGVPFWGKPPLSFWLTTMSMNFLGVNEFAARIPSLILGVIVSALVWHIASKKRNSNYALVSILLLNSMLLFWISSGAVMTDHALLTGITLSMVAFWLTLKNESTTSILWGYVFFVGIAIGLLAKGPVILVLVGLPAVVWVLISGQWREVLRGFPWISGLCLTAAITLPWYILAEVQTPGFLNYFIIGEHWNRFLVPGWEGDLYGSGHLTTRGTIWLYWMVCALPWSVVLPIFAFSKQTRKGFRLFFSRRNDWTLYLVLWTITPMLFFTLARNILPAYVLPGLPGFSLLLSEIIFLCPDEQRKKINKSVKWIVSGQLLLLTIVFVYVALGNGPAERSQENLVASFYEDRESKASQLIYPYNGSHAPYSADFYSGGQALYCNGLDGAKQFLLNNVVDYFAIKVRIYQKFPPNTKNRFIQVGRFNNYYLLKESTPVG